MTPDLDTSLHMVNITLWLVVCEILGYQGDDLGLLSDAVC